MQNGLPPGPFSGDEPLTKCSPEEFQASLDRAGIRLMPYPFDSALAVASDVDGSSRERFDGYTGMLVHELGLDFGDSAWLHWRYGVGATGQLGTAHSGGFLSPSLTTETTDRARTFVRNRTFREMLAEYHAGNIDHFHAWLPHGPRIAVLHDVTKRGSSLVARIPPIDASCNDFHLVGVCLIFEGSVEPGIVSVEAECADGSTASYEPADYDAPNDGKSYALFLQSVDPLGSQSVPHLRYVEQISARAGSDSCPMPARILLLGAYGPMLLDRVRLLRDTYNVEMPLITEHAKLHFRYPVGTDWVRKRNARLYSEQQGKLTAFVGPIVDGDGEQIASADSDEPHSFARVLPEAVEQLELRFIVPQPSTSNVGLVVTDLLSRSPTRSGGGFYWARRVMPNAEPPPPGEMFDGQTKHSTFAARIESAIDSAAAEPGRFWPIYTHVGSLAIVDGKRIPLPDPYFDPGPLLKLQDRVYGISADLPTDGRIWFTRASTLYDYALVLQHMPGAVERGGGDIRLRSWDDPVLGKRLPRTPSQLYGLTFYVPDEATALVTLDGQAMNQVVRNPADSSGSPSVTIAECDLSTTVFRSLDPAAASGASVRGGEWQWTGGDLPFGRLTCAADSEPATLRLPMHGTSLPGAQLLSFAARADVGCEYGILLETRSGGRFWFGSASLADTLENITARYSLDRLTSSNARQTLVVPFYAVSWAESARAGGPLPSHPLEAVSLVTRGARGALTEFADVRLLRPRASLAAHHPAEGHCVVGHLQDSTEGATVRMRPVGKPEEQIVTGTDQLGWFAFTGVAPGVYEVTGSSGGTVFRPERGAAIEVWSDIARLELTATT